jgi:hypothetical protein
MVYDCLVASAEILFNDSGAVLAREPVDAAFVRRSFRGDVG